MQVPAHVEYERATSVEHALSLLARFGPEARILAGGHSLIPMMKLRLAQPETLIDINDLSELARLGVVDGQLRIGAMVRHAQLLDHAKAGELFAILHDAERVIADPIVRNWGTIGGSVCQANPCPRTCRRRSRPFRPPWSSRARTVSGTVPARDFHTGPYETVVRQPNEGLWHGSGHVSRSNRHFPGPFREGSRRTPLLQDAERGVESGTGARRDTGGRKGRGNAVNPMAEKIIGLLKTRSDLGKDMQ